MLYGPEPRLEPIDSEVYVTGDCGHEIYEGEPIIEWDGKSICDECFWDNIKELTVSEVAAQFDCEISMVRRR